MKEIVDGLEHHNKILRDLGLPEITREKYLESLKRTPLESIEDQIAAILRNKNKGQK
jgi:hypothetical protein